LVIVLEVRINLDTSDWDKKIRTILLGIDGWVPNITAHAIDIIDRNMRSVVPVRSGRLRDTISKQMTSDHSGIVQTTTGYGLFADQPTKAHEIRARRKKALRFEIDGRWFFRKRVWHPGTVGTFFGRQTIERSTQHIREAIVEYWNRMTR
jgi:hypothetical protein